ncbi:hypothetical protein B0H21DRAFT_701994, partial [Amylocystis lapponica]
IIEDVGPFNFRGICSDNTGNTSAARKMINRDYPWIMILPDPCHRLNSLCSDICKIDVFKPTIKHLRRSLKFFKKSDQAKDKLTKRRRKLGISRGLRSIGKTRFATMYHSAASMQRCLPAIRELCAKHQVVVKEINHIFLPGLTSLSFSFGLEQLTALLCAPARAITCLEGPSSGVSDVYVMWLASAASTFEILDAAATGNSNYGVGLDGAVATEIHEAVNYRFDQMINNAPCDVYLTGFLLDPRT